MLTIHIADCSTSELSSNSITIVPWGGGAKDYSLLFTEIDKFHTFLDTYYMKLVRQNKDSKLK